MLLRISVSHTYTQLGGGSLKGHEDYYCPLVFAIGLTIPPHHHPHLGLHPEALIAFGKAKACGFSFLI